MQYDGNYYFDPGLSAVQQLVIDGAEEIVRNYEVDGIHLDDYFIQGLILTTPPRSRATAAILRISGTGGATMSTR